MNVTCSSNLNSIKKCSLYVPTEERLPQLWPLPTLAINLDNHTTTCTLDTPDKKKTQHKSGQEKQTTLGTGNLSLAMFSTNVH